MRREDSLPIGKDYVPKMGDLLFNDSHPLIIIANIYSLDRSSLQVNKNFKLELLKHEFLKKIIQRKEIIWSQHKNDFRLFPDNDIHGKTSNREGITYRMYCYYNDFEQYIRLYASRYYNYPQEKVRVVTGTRKIVTVDHSLCKDYYFDGTNGTNIRNVCNYWGGKRSEPLSSLVTKKFKYLGNLYLDFLKEDIMGNYI